MVAADALKRLMRRPASAHVVLGVHLEEAGLRAFRQDSVQVLVLEAGPGRVRDGQGREAETTVRAYVPSREMAFMVVSALGRPLALSRSQRAVLATRNHDVRASAAKNELPGIALEINGRGALAGRPRAGGAIVLPFEGDAVALLLTSSRRRVSFRFRQRRGAATDAIAVAIALAKRAELKQFLRT